MMKLSGLRRGGLESALMATRVADVTLTPNDLLHVAAKTCESGITDKNVWNSYMDNFGVPLVSRMDVAQMKVLIRCLTRVGMKKLSVSNQINHILQQMAANDLALLPPK